MNDVGLTIIYVYGWKKVKTDITTNYSSTFLHKTFVNFMLDSTI